MAKQITAWTPDTHPGVTVYLEWDDAVPAEDRVHTFRGFACKGDEIRRVNGEPTFLKRGALEKKEPKAARFSGLTEQQQYEKVLSENRTKNIALGELLAEVPDDAKVRETDGEGNESVRFKQEPKWSIGEDGVVEIELPKTLASQVRSAAKSSVEGKHAGKVRVV